MKKRMDKVRESEEEKSNGLYIEPVPNTCIIIFNSKYHSNA
jgi:hypothetical protein